MKREEHTYYRRNAAQSEWVMIEADRIITEVLRDIKYKWDSLTGAVNSLIPVPIVLTTKNGSRSFEVETGAGRFVMLVTDGIRLFYDPDNILCFGSGTTGRCELELKILHIIIHGLLGHFGRGEASIDRSLLWQVMDIQVTAVMNMMDIKRSGVRYYIPNVGKWFESEVGESLYYKALTDKALRGKIRNIGRECYLDDHHWWKVGNDDRNGEAVKVNFREGRINLVSTQGEETVGEDEGNGTSGTKGKQRNHEGNTEGMAEGITDSAAKMWEAIREGLMGSAQPGLEVLAEKISKEVIALGYALRGEPGRVRGTGTLGEGRMYKAKEASGTYRSLLEKLWSIGEVNKEEDIIDPVLYSYGLHLYGDVPIIEPMDIVESIRLNTIVVAMDTSGSCAEALDRFWGEARQLFKDIAEHGSIEEVELIECDSKIRRSETIWDVDRLEAIPLKHEFFGFGGTDFRPVFERTDNRSKHGAKIDCLIYFSDGDGDFPEEKPDYPVYFVIPREALNAEDPYFEEELLPEIPEWVNVIHDSE